MDANTYDIKTVLTLDRRFVVPPFNATTSGRWRDNGSSCSMILKRSPKGSRKRGGQPCTMANRRRAPTNACRHTFWGRSFSISYLAQRGDWMCDRLLMASSD